MSFPFLQAFSGLGNGLQTKNAAGGGGGGGVGGWVELGRTTLGSSSSTIDVSGLTSKRYLMLLIDALPVSSVYHQGRFNGDTGSNYANRRSWDGGADSALTSRNLLYEGGNGSTTRHFDIHYISNYSTKEKLDIGNTVYQNTAGAANAPKREEFVSKWANTSNAITRYTEVPQLDNLASGSEVVVLGYDPADTHSNNFWTELASVELGSAGDTINSGTITAKKYLWFQCYTKGANTETQFRFNSDSGSNYASRRQADGASDTTHTSQSMSKINATGGGASYTACFMNGFIINTASKEKLVITHQIAEDAGTGAGNAPRRTEGVTKWTNTSNQITSIQIQNNSTGDFASGSILKIWGSD